MCFKTLFLSDSVHLCNHLYNLQRFKEKTHVGGCRKVLETGAGGTFVLTAVRLPATENLQQKQYFSTPDDFINGFSAALRKMS